MEVFSNIYDHISKKDRLRDRLVVVIFNKNKEEWNNYPKMCEKFFNQFDEGLLLLPTFVGERVNVHCYVTGKSFTIEQLDQFAMFIAGYCSNR